MHYVLAKERKPESGVDVHVVTDKGTRGVAKYWDLTGAWLTMDCCLETDAIVKKWKYADAKLTEER